MDLPNFTFEDRLLSQGYLPLGVDEVGRGAFAGPVGVGGVVFKSFLDKDRSDLLKLGINDSKKLSTKKREELAVKLKEVSLYEVVFIDVPTINAIGIGKAVFLGMKEIVFRLNKRLKNEKLFVLVDAYKIPDIPNRQKGIIRGDSLSISIASASIVAKVERDHLMKKLEQSYPLYDLADHKGYGTSKHREKIKKYGLTPCHRVDFCHKTLSYSTIYSVKH